MMLDGQKVRELRGMRLLSREQLAELADCSDKTIENIEGSRNWNAQSSTAKNLAKALEVDLEEIRADRFQNGGGAGFWDNRKPIASIVLKHWKLITSISAVVVVAGILLYIFLPCCPPPCDFNSGRLPILASLEGVTGKITTPKDCGRLPFDTRLQVGGEYSGNLHGKNLAVVVWAQENGEYYPQALDACGEVETATVNYTGQRWDSLIVLGGPDPGRIYDVILGVVEGGSNAEASFNQWFEARCAEVGDWGIGLLSLPSGFVELDAITVQTGSE